MSGALQARREERLAAAGRRRVWEAAHAAILGRPGPDQLALFPLAAGELPLLAELKKDPLSADPAAPAWARAPEPAPLLECAFCGGVADQAPACSACLADAEGEGLARLEYERRP